LNPSNPPDERQLSAVNPHAQTKAVSFFTSALRAWLRPSATATIRVQREHPANMPWLQLHTGVRGKFPAPAPATGTVGLALGGGTPTDSHQVHDDAPRSPCTPPTPPAPGSAHIYRVTAAQGGTSSAATPSSSWADEPTISTSRTVDDSTTSRDALLLR
jgi:hypothetical protein